MRNGRAGFTLPELIVVLVIVSILANISFQRMGPARDLYQVRAARSAFASLHSRARATAIERGTFARFDIDPSGDSAWISTATDTIETFRFRDNLNVDVTSGDEPVRICMSPRGYAEPSCSTFSGSLTLSFARGEELKSIRVLPLGQLVYLE